MPDPVHHPVGLHDTAEEVFKAPGVTRPPFVDPFAGSTQKRRVQVRRFAGHSAFCEHFETPLRLVHITDQHVGRVTPFAIQMEAVALANAAQPDLVCLTGDFVAHSCAYLDQLEEVIAAFTSPVICVLGNHDHWSGADDVRQALIRAGAMVLDNAHTVLNVHGARLQVVGLDDAYTGHADVGRAVKGLDTKLPTIGLSHIAEEADRLWHHGVPLVLSGHTHAGQITLARLHELAIGRIGGHKYVHGLYGSRRGESGAVYVGAGIGAAVMPVRLGERGQREVTVFELGVPPGGYDDEHHQEQIALPGRKPSEKVKAKRHAFVMKKRAARERKISTRAPTPPASH